MALITRISRLFRADLHAVLDRIEEPDLLLRQAIREMEEAYARDEQRFKLLSHEEAQLTTRKNDLDLSLEQLSEELDVCFSADNEELARTLIRRKLEMQQQTRFLGRKQQGLQETLKELKERLEENHNHLESMRQKAELLTEDENPAAVDTDWRTTEFSIGEADVEVAYLREKQRRSRS